MISEECTNQKVKNIAGRGGAFHIETTDKTLAAEKIVLCAGLDNQRLGEMLEMNIPVVMDRGQVMITERLKPFLDLPTLLVRQTAEGTIQIGDSHESVGLDDGTSPDVLKKIAHRAVLMFPFAVAIAGQAGVNPRPLVMAVAFAASASFMTPLGYQTNLMVYGPGGYRFMDFVRVGLPLNMILLVCAVILIPMAWPF